MNSTTDQQIANMTEEIALPRKNGELVFETPWEARAFGIAVALNEGGVYEWPEFSTGLGEIIAAAEKENVPSSYYERWLAALEDLAIRNGLVTPEEITTRVGEIATHDDHEHDHDHPHHHHHNGHSA